MGPCYKTMGGKRMILAYVFLLTLTWYKRKAD